MCTQHEASHIVVLLIIKYYILLYTCTCGTHIHDFTCTYMYVCTVFLHICVHVTLYYLFI